jgi:DNA-binding beta-propeller fold protein YncE
MKLLNVERLAVALSFVFCASGLVSETYAKPKPVASGYHLIKTVPLSPAPGTREYFDYITVDAEARRVYVSHGTEVAVMNADDDSVVGKIQGGLKLCHGVAIVKSLGKGYITDGEAESVFVFDLKTLKITGEIKTNQPDTDSLIYEPVTKHIFTFNGHSHNTTVIDPAKESVITNIDLVGGVEFPAVDGKGIIYDNNEDNNDIVAIDAKTSSIKARWPAAPSGQLVAMAMDRKIAACFPPAAIHNF